MKRGYLVAVLVAVLAVTGCGGESSGASTPTQPTTPPSTMLEQFSGTILPGGADTYTFTLSSNGIISVEVASLVPLNSLGFFFGTPSGNVCLAVVPVGTVTQNTVLVESANSGAVCIQIYDAGQVPPTGIAYVVNVRHP